MNATSLAESQSLHARAKAMVEAYEAGAPMPEAFDALACDLGRYQAAAHAGYGRLCKARGVNTIAAKAASEFPAVPSDTFKLSRVATFPKSSEAVVFRTSGTTVGRRGEHSFRDVSTYDTAAIAFGRWALMSGVNARIPVVVLGPSPNDMPDSSLTHMIDLFVREFGLPATIDETYFIKDEVIDLAGLDERIARCIVDGTPNLLVLGTSFAFVHLLDALGDENTFSLPPGSRVMQTGGFKGRSREVDAITLRRSLARAFGIHERSIVAEYGMTELSSQFYEGTLVDECNVHGVYLEPPWARVVPVDPETLEPVPFGQVGIARIEDLMNVDSAFAILVPDRVRRTEKGFELLGRTPGAPPRGCSLGIDEILAS